MSPAFVGVQIYGEKSITCNGSNENRRGEKIHFPKG